MISGQENIIIYYSIFLLLLLLYSVYVALNYKDITIYITDIHGDIKEIKTKSVKKNSSNFFL